MQNTPKKRGINSGTRIEIEFIRTNTWNEKKIDNVVEAIQRLTPPLFFTDKKDRQDFEVVFYRSDSSVPVSEPRQEHLHVLLENKRLFYIEGQFDSKENCFLYSLTTSLSGRETTDQRIVALDNDVLRKLKLYQKEFSAGIDRPLECGTFDFCFYIFDFKQQTLPEYALIKEDRNKIKSHRIYLYRDGIRVYPYGDPEDDWLEIDVLRGTYKAGESFSNDQVVGCVTITQ